MFLTCSNKDQLINQSINQSAHIHAAVDSGRNCLLGPQLRRNEVESFRALTESQTENGKVAVQLEMCITRHGRP